MYILASGVAGGGHGPQGLGLHPGHGIAPSLEREFFIDDLLLRIHYIIVMMPLPLTLISDTQSLIAPLLTLTPCAEPLLLCACSCLERCPTYGIAPTLNLIPEPADLNPQPSLPTPIRHCLGLHPGHGIAPTLKNQSLNHKT